MIRVVLGDELGSGDKVLQDLLGNVCCVKTLEMVFCVWAGFAGLGWKSTGNSQFTS